MRLIKILSFLLVGGGLLLLVLIYGPIFREEIRYRTVAVKKEVFPDKEIVPVSTDFGLMIPEIGVNVRVFPQVNANDPQEYLPLLAKGVAHSKGSSLPGQKGNVFIFAHSAASPLNISRFNAVFYLINKLNQEDEIIIYYQNQKYEYRVWEKKIVTPEALSGFLQTLENNFLILQTCYPPGTTLNRLLVIAKEAD